MNTFSSMFSVSIEQSPPHNNIGDLGRGVEGAGIPHKLYEIQTGQRTVPVQS